MMQPIIVVAKYRFSCKSKHASRKNGSLLLSRDERRTRTQPDKTNSVPEHLFYASVRRNEESRVTRPAIDIASRLYFVGSQLVSRICARAIEA